MSSPAFRVFRRNAGLQSRANRRTIARVQNAQAFPPAATSVDTVEALFSSHGPARPWIHWLLVSCAAGGLASLPLVKVDITVRAPGVVRPAAGRTEIRSPFGSEVAQALIRDNDRVGAGQPLFVLRTADLDERIVRNGELQRSTASLIADLVTLSAMNDDEPANRAAQGQLLLPPTSPASPGTGSGNLVATAALRGEMAELAARAEANRLAEAKGQTELARATALADRGIASRRELDDARYALERTQAEGRLLLRQAQSRWQARLHEERTTLDSLRSEAVRLESERTLATIRAPAAGTIQVSPGLRPGAFVAPGELLGIISPDEELLVEAAVSPRDIGQVYPGQPAKLQIDAFPHTDWGLLEGTVVQVSDDLVADEPVSPGAAFRYGFRVLIRPAATQLRRFDGTEATLRKGLTVNARLRASRRSLFEILCDDAGAWLDPQRNPATR